MFSAGQRAVKDQFPASATLAFPNLEWHKLASPTEHPAFTYYGFQPSKTILPTCHVRLPGLQAFLADVIYDRDYPLLTGTGPQSYDSMAPFLVGLEKSRTSGYEKFEYPDPAEWALRGYAIVNLDARGCDDSEGNISFWGQQEAEDIYDTIDWLSKRRSRDLVLRGGRAHNEKFHSMILTGFAGHGSAENMPAMIRKRPFYDDYWQSKCNHPERIKDVPPYVLASDFSMLHTRGSFQTFRAARPRMVEDLAQYFVRYLKGIENNLESTPPLRLLLLGFENSAVQTIRERPEQEYSLARQELKKFYLNQAVETLQPDQLIDASFVAHAGRALEASPPDSRAFTSGCLARDHNDMDVAVQIRKVNKNGMLLAHLNYPCPVPVTEVPNVNTVKTLGPSASCAHRTQSTHDEVCSTAEEFVYRHDRHEPVAPQTIVPLEISLWPMGMVFGPGEGIMLRVSVHDMCLPKVGSMRPAEPDDENKGKHQVYRGGFIHLSRT
ncbi:alpha/beta-hydrolase [Aspergillus homomorphus CBS 101889]|uniref:Alpha/beta-hydrolase n=1 Tax=Aspergillus homomorphus (strain CBS 101889) TaxID=1450537 RepID=A0A395I5R8_ASPHC|nr:alpha/beta-hydrolase [Aspergillus homomorphus CBS 101889]RAL15582.1 alpha/beta-hydrolase [Aspergillus homomorphus CBS 101889]